MTFKTLAVIHAALTAQLEAAKLELTAATEELERSKKEHRGELAASGCCFPAGYLPEEHPSMQRVSKASTRYKDIRRALSDFEESDWH